MSKLTSAPKLLALAAVVLGACVAIMLVPAMGSASSEPKDAKRCWYNDRFGHNDDIPSKYDNHDKFANCSDCEPFAVLRSDDSSAYKCDLWFGGQTKGGGVGTISHSGWPGLTGIRWQIVDDNNKGETRYGTRLNDGLYGRNGNDKLYGMGGNDVLWGDANATLNRSTQKDKLDGGDGNDWIYASHGRNTIRGGGGKDIIIAYFGRGSIDCGGGTDTISIPHFLPGKKKPYKITNCENITHPGSY